MKMDALKNLLSQNNSSITVKGEWFSIRWTPDVAAGEIINIGVAFVENGRVHSRLLNYFERIECLYGDRGIYHAELVISIVAESLKKNNKDSPIPQISYQNRGYAQGSSIDEVLSSLFKQTVPIAKKIRITNSKERFNSLSTDKLYIKLLDELKILSGLDFERFTPPNSSIRIQDSTGSHDLFIPFRDEIKLVGGLASTVYSNPATIELNLLKAARDVESAIRLGFGKKPAVFLLKPGDELDKLESEQIISIENVLDKFDWHMTKQKITIGSHTTISGLAQEITEWAA